MAPPTRSTLRLFFLLLSCSLVASWIVPRDSPLDTLLVSPGNHGYHGLLPRQAGDSCNLYPIDDPNAPSCRALCSAGTCGSQPGKREVKLPLVEGDLVSGLTNASDVDESAWKRTIVKRTFEGLTQGQIATYLPNQWNEAKVDANYGFPQSLVENDGNGDFDTTVTAENVFGSKGFAVGAQELHGCTMVTVVSKRAVYMGHFWERPSWTNKAQFPKRVLYHISGDPRAQFSLGPALTVSNYNQATDDTRIYIMTARGKQNDAGSTQYSDKIDRLKNLLQGMLPNAKIVVYNYWPLDWKTQKNLVGTNQRGFALFQFDPSGRGRNKPGWRLFYEHHAFRDTDVAVSVNGVPDQ